jgi:hypothetical protein
MGSSSQLRFAHLDETSLEKVYGKSTALRSDEEGTGFTCWQKDNNLDALDTGSSGNKMPPNNRAQGLRQAGMKLKSPYGTACSAPVESLPSGFPVLPHKHWVKL